MLDLASFGAWLPGAGVVLDSLTMACEPGQIWAVVGRTGAGSSTLLRAVAGRLPPGAHVSGDIRWRGSPVPPPAGDLCHVGDLPPMEVAEYLTGFTDDARGVAEASGLGGHLAHRVGTLPPDLRVALRAAALRHSPVTPLLLLDAELTAASPAVRHEVAQEVTARARAGAAVLCADHDLVTLRQMATHILELDRGRTAYAGEAAAWRPRSLLPSPGAVGVGRRPPAAATVIDPAAVGLTGRSLEVGATECLGLVDLSGRPEPLARRIIAHLGGRAVASHLPRATRLARAHHDEVPLWLPHPQAGLDPVARQELAASLSGENPGPRLVTSRDPDFLARACRRIAVVDDGRVVAVGSPTAVSRHLPGRLREAS